MVTTITAIPAAGPLTLTDEPLKLPTMIPPMIPLKIPENRGAPEAMEMPKQRGIATKKTTNAAVKSNFK